MSTGEAAVPGGGRQVAKRPSAWRKAGSAYLDFLFASFLGLLGATAFQSREDWAFVALTLLLGQSFLCRATLKPTLGDLFMNIRYLTSSSNQVVADIRVVNPKVKLNGFLLFAGVVELTWAVFGLSAWAFFDAVASLGRIRTGQEAFLVTTVFGFVMLLCASSILSGSRMARWAVPLAHLFLVLDHFTSLGAWVEALSKKDVLWPWAEKAAAIEPQAIGQALALFALWSLVLSLGTAFSRKHLVL